MNWETYHKIKKEIAEIASWIGAILMLLLAISPVLCGLLILVSKTIHIVVQIWTN